MEERAKTEHANDIKEGVPSVKVDSKSIKRPCSGSSVIPTKKRKTAARSNQRQKKKTKSRKLAKQRKSIKTKPVTKKRQIPVKKTKSAQVKKFKIDAYKSIFRE